MKVYTVTKGFEDLIGINNYTETKLAQTKEEAAKIVEDWYDEEFNSALATPHAIECDYEENDLNFVMTVGDVYQVTVTTSEHGL